MSHPGWGTTASTHRDGAFAIGEPRSASTWFPVNEHPRTRPRTRLRSRCRRGWRRSATGCRPDGAATRARLDTVAVGGAAPDGQLPGHGGDRGLPGDQTGSTPAGRWWWRSTPTCRRRIDQQLLRPDRSRTCWRSWFGPYPFEAYGGVVAGRPAWGSHWRPRAARSTARFFIAGQDGTRGDRARTGPPVVRQQRVDHQLAGHWLNEGFATYAEWLFERVRRRRHRAGDIRSLLGRARRGRTGFGATPTGGSGRRSSCSIRGVRTRGDDPARAAGHGRRRGVLRDPA